MDGRKKIMDAVISQWIPSTVLAAVLLSALRYGFNKLDKLLEKIGERLTDLEKASMGYATVDQLGRLGDRIDGRTTNVAERVAVLEALGKR